MAAPVEAVPDPVVRPRSYKNDRYRHGFLGAVGDLQKAGVLQDVVLEVEGRRFPCHRLVLSAASPYFRAMFTGNMAESRQKSVVLQGLDADMLEEILSYIYSGTLHVSLDKLQPLYQAADLLQVDYVTKTCASYMAMNVEPSTCLDMYMFANVFSERIVKKRCLQCIYENFTKVCTTAEFCSLSVNQLTDIISHDELDVKEETTVWEAVVRWVEHSREDRRHNLPSILTHIRFHLMTAEDMAAILKHPLVKEDPGSSHVIRNVVQTSDLKTRFGIDKQEMVMLFSNCTYEMLCMNPRIGKYISSTYPEMMSVIAVTVTSDNNVYILTGEEFDSELSLKVYSHAGNVWEHLSSVPRRKGDPFLGDLPSYEFFVEVCGHLYYLSFIYQLDDVLMWMRKYNRHNNQWLECSQLQIERGYKLRMAVSCASHLYFIMETEMHRYDPSNDRWCTLAPPIAELQQPDPFRAPINSNTAAVIGTEIFCMRDSYGHYGDMLVYDTELDSWRELRDAGLPEPPDHHPNTIVQASIFVLESQLHVLFRHNKFVSQRSEWQMYVYYKSEGVWREREVDMPRGDWDCCEPGCCVVRMNLAYLHAKSADTLSTSNP